MIELDTTLLSLFKMKAFIRTCDFCLFYMGATLLNADWLKQRACLLNSEGTFGNQGK